MKLYFSSQLICVSFVMLRHRSLNGSLMLQTLTVAKRRPWLILEDENVQPALF